jgi:radical SAM protein with 4Fe4S-binding SPASM domain
VLAGLNQAIRRAYHAEGKLYELQLDLLYQCDLDCEHCYLDDKKKRVLSTAFWKDVIDQAAMLQVFTLLISGGEIFLRKDLLELLAHARMRGLFVHLKSHGGLIDADSARELGRIGVSSVWLSYYSTDAAVHDAITRVPGSHAATRAAMDHLQAAGVTVLVACAVMQRNKDSWRAVVDECAARGISVSLDGEIRAAHSGATFPRDTALDLDDLTALEAFQLAREGGCEVPSASNDWGQLKNCAAGTLALYVSPEGDVTPCVTWPEPLGNLARGDRLADLWRRSARLRGIQAHTRSDRALCATCPVREDCDFCMGQSFVETGDPHRAIATVCETTRAKTLARARAAGLPDPPLPAGLARPRFSILDPAQVEAARRS